MGTMPSTSERQVGKSVRSETEDEAPSLVLIKEGCNRCTVGLDRELHTRLLVLVEEMHEGTSVGIYTELQSPLAFLVREVEDRAVL